MSARRIVVLGLGLVMFGCSSSPKPACCVAPDGGGSLDGGLSGVAATGHPIAAATVTLKDSAGTTKTATTDSAGKFTLDLAGVVAPFLLKVDLATGTSLYSVGSQVGVVNIHPLTDLIIELWYKVQG